MNHPLFEDVQLPQLQQASRDFIELAPGSSPEQLANGMKCLNLMYWSFRPRCEVELAQADAALASALKAASGQQMA